MESRPTESRQAENRWYATIRDLASRTLGPGPVNVYLFGSRAVGTARPASDIDVAVESSGRLATGALPRFREALEESSIPVRVDVVDLDEAGPTFRERVMKEGIRWTVSKSA